MDVGAGCIFDSALFLYVGRSALFSRFPGGASTVDVMLSERIEGRKASASFRVGLHTGASVRRVLLL